LIIKHFGYRRIDDEIIKCAKLYGFELDHQENYAFLIEFQRSYFLRKLINTLSIVKNCFSFIGRYIPYIRMFCFRKVN
jgi:hypothetical protein